jgi:HlyD family secretion protein
VKKGQVLAKIYADIYASTRDQAAAQVNQSQSQVDNSVAALAATKARMDQAKRQYDRQKQLYDDKVISKLEFETAENAYLTAEADYNAALQGIKGGQANVKSASANLSKANKDLSRTSLVAPMGGVISLLNVKRGERVVGSNMMAGTEMMRIADMRVIEVRVDVGENDIPKVKLGDSATVEVDAYNTRKFPGVVTQIDNPMVNTSTTTSTSTEVTNYKVHVRLDPKAYKDLVNPDRPKAFPFRPGMSASADIQTKTHGNVIAVPINAVTTRDKSDTSKAVAGKAPAAGPAPAAGGGPGGEEKKVVVEDLQEVVFIMQPGGSVKRVNVKTDIQDINYIEIKEGIKEGDEVITGPYTVVSKMLRDGMKVSVVPKEQLFEIKK